jgi:hypothetical protein
VAKRPLTQAELEQRRAAAKLGGRPANPVSRRSVDETAKARVALARARGRIKSVQDEVAKTLISGMRGMLPGSTAQTMIQAATALGAKGGLHDLPVDKHAGAGAPVNVRIAVDMDSKYPKPIEETDGRRAPEGGPALAH